MKRIGLFKAEIKSLFFLVFVLINTNVLAQNEILKLSNGKTVILYSDKTWDYQKEIKYDYDFSNIKDNEIPDFLRKGVNADRITLTQATELYLQGWRYKMPQPKSSQAHWGNYDGRTTWWNGYWYNSQNSKFSQTTPKKQNNGLYYGDNQNRNGTWRNGGSPKYPTVIEWLLSSSGGIKPK